MDLEEEKERADLECRDHFDARCRMKQELEKYKSDFEDRVKQGNEVLYKRTLALTDIFNRMEGLLKRDHVLWKYWQTNPELKRLRKEGGME